MVYNYSEMVIKYDCHRDNTTEHRKHHHKTSFKTTLFKMKYFN